MGTKTRQSIAIELIDIGAGEQLSFDRLSTVSGGLKNPVSLPGLCVDAEAVGTWTLLGMLEREQDRVVPVEYYAAGDKRKPYELQHIPLRDYAAAIERGDHDYWFLAEQNLDDIFPSAAGELPKLSVLPSNAGSVIRSVFFGIDTASATHFHTRDQAILVQVTGSKKVVLALPTAPLATNRVLSGRPQFSTCGPEPGGDAAAYFSDLLDGETVVVDLSPGDALFIPVHWWHWAESRDESLSVTTFWRASPRDWVFPTPGFRALTAVVVGTAAGLVRRAAALVLRRS